MQTALKAVHDGLHGYGIPVHGSHPEVKGFCYEGTREASVVYGGDNIWLPRNPAGPENAVDLSK